MHYVDACITNGLQTLTLARILIMIKIFQMYSNRKQIHKKILYKNNMEKNFKESIRKYLPEVSDFLIDTIPISQINKVLYWLNKQENKEYIESLNNMSVENILNIRISFKAILLDELVQIYDEENSNIDIQRLGYNIANSNNETQAVKEDDKFGTEYKEWIENNLVSEVSDKKVAIEYRKFSIPKKNMEIPVKHILEILRIIIPTAIIVEYKNEGTEEFINVAAIISKFANNRVPVYNFFQKLIELQKENKSKSLNDAIIIIRNLMPDLIEMMLHFEEKIKDYYTMLNFKQVTEFCKLINYTELKKTLDLKESENDENILDNAIKRKFRFSPSNLFPIFIFATRSAIKINQKLEVSYKLDNEDIYFVMDKVYCFVLQERLRNPFCSTSDLFRNPTIYSQSQEMFKARSRSNENDDYTAKFRVNLSNL